VKENPMKKFAILVVACTLAIGSAACSKKKASTTPANTDTTTETGTGDAMGGDAYGGDAYGNPCEAANPCGM